MRTVLRFLGIVIILGLVAAIALIVVSMTTGTSPIATRSATPAVPKSPASAMATVTPTPTSTTRTPIDAWGLETKWVHLGRMSVQIPASFVKKNVGGERSGFEVTYEDPNTCAGGFCEQIILLAPEPIDQTTYYTRLVEDQRVNCHTIDTTDIGDVGGRYAAKHEITYAVGCDNTRRFAGAWHLANFGLDTPNDSSDNYGVMIRLQPRSNDGNDAVWTDGVFRTVEIN